MGKWTRDTDSKGNTTGMGHRDPKREGGDAQQREREGHKGDTYEPGAHQKTTMHRERGTGRSGNK